MDSHVKRLRTLARAANRCGIGPMLSIIPGSIQETALGQVQFPSPESGSYEEAGITGVEMQALSSRDNALAGNNASNSVQSGRLGMHRLWEEDRSESDMASNSSEYDQESLDIDQRAGLLLFALQTPSQASWLQMLRSIPSSRFQEREYFSDLSTC